MKNKRQTNANCWLQKLYQWTLLLMQLTFKQEVSCLSENGNFRLTFCSRNFRNKVPQKKLSAVASKNSPWKLILAPPLSLSLILIDIRFIKKVWSCVLIGYQEIHWSELIFVAQPQRAKVEEPMNKVITWHLISCCLVIWNLSSHLWEVYLIAAWIYIIYLIIIERSIWLLPGYLKVI